MKAKLHNLRLKYKIEQDTLRRKEIMTNDDSARLIMISGALEAISKLQPSK